MLKRNRENQIEELLNHQRSANINERHNYLKRQIERTKVELELELLRDQEELEQRRRFMSVPRNRDSGVKSSLLPMIEQGHYRNDS